MMSNNETNEDSVFLYHEACPKCSSKDNLGRFSDGHAYCFGCGHREPSDALYVPPKNVKVKKGDKPLFPLGAYEDLPSWKIKEETCKKFGYSRSPYGGGCHIAAIRDQEGNITAQKVRYFKPKKMFSWRGNKSDKCQLFGQHLWTTKSGPKLVITEGEKDCLAVSQQGNNKWPVVSVLNGAGGAEKDCKDNLEWLLQFPEIVLMFDMDKAGQEAAVKVAKLFPPNKVKIAKLPRGDAFDCWKAGEGHLITKAVFDAEPYRPANTVTAKDVLSEACQVPAMGASYPWQVITEATFGRQDCQVIVIGAGIGAGKTTVVTQLLEHDLFTLGVPVGVFHSEQLPAETVQNIAGMRANKILNRPESDREELRKYCKEVSDKPLYLFDDGEDFCWETIEETARYWVTSLGVKHLYLDNLSSVIAHEDDKNAALQSLMKELTLFAKKTGCIWHVVSHLTTPEKGSHEEGARVTARQLYGSRAIAQWAHAIIGLERNQQHEDLEERLKLKIRFLKYRLVGATANGKTYDVRYDVDTGRYSEVLEGSSDGGESFEPVIDNEGKY